MLWQFTVGLRVNRKADRVVVEAEDALIAALKVKAERPQATVMYVRRLNRRGDTRHPPNTLHRRPLIVDSAGKNSATEIALGRAAGRRLS